VEQVEVNPHLAKASQDIRRMLGLLVINQRRRGIVGV
jgi:ribosomal protein S15P/S13E